MIDIVNKKLQKRLEDLKLFDKDANLEIILKIFNDFIKNVGSGYASKEFNSKLNKIQRTLKDSVFERQADEYSTLYAHIAGYKTSQLGEQLLDSIYINYNLKDSELFRYPSLVDRKKIVRLSSNKFLSFIVILSYLFNEKWALNNFCWSFSV